MARAISNGGVVFTRWGRFACPNTTRTQLLYKGKAAGSHYSHTGGGANYIFKSNDYIKSQEKNKIADRKLFQEKKTLAQHSFQALNHSLHNYNYSYLQCKRKLSN